MVSLDVEQHDRIRFRRHQRFTGYLPSILTSMTFTNILYTSHFTSLYSNPALPIVLLSYGRFELDLMKHLNTYHVFAGLQALS